MKTKTILTVLLILFAIVAKAQEEEKKEVKPDKSPEVLAENKVKMLENDIEFTAEERDSLVGIFKDYYVEAKQYKKEENKDKLSELKDARDEKVKELLGEERFAIYVEKMKKPKPEKNIKEKISKEKIGPKMK